jgi:hypothetical protein
MSPLAPGLPERAMRLHDSSSTHDHLPLEPGDPLLRTPQRASCDLQVLCGSVQWLVGGVCGHAGNSGRLSAGL